MRQPFSVNVVITTRVGEAFEVLLLKRKAKPELALGDFWQTVTGGVEDSETLEIAARREVLEETGFSDLILLNSGYSCAFPMKPQWADKYPIGASHITEATFLAILPDKHEPSLSDEHSVFRWLDFREASELMAFENNRESLYACESLLNRRS